MGRFGISVFTMGILSLGIRSQSGRVNKQPAKGAPRFGKPGRCGPCWASSSPSWTWLVAVDATSLFLVSTRYASFFRAVTFLVLLRGSYVCICFFIIACIYIYTHMWMLEEQLPLPKGIV